MKKILVIICAFFTPILVFAKEKPFYEKFQTNSYSIEENMPFESQTIELNKFYYVFSNYVDRNHEINAQIRKYNQNGELIKSKNIKESLFTVGTTDGNNIYIVLLLTDNLEFIKIDTELNEINKYIFTEEEIYSINEITAYQSFPINLDDLINVKNNKLNFFLGNNILQFELSLSKYNLLQTNELNVYELFPKIYKQDYFETYIYDNNDDYQIYIENICNDQLYIQCNSNDVLKVLNSDDDLLWQKAFEIYEDDDYVTISDAKIVDDYIVILRNYSNKEESAIIIYDFKGNLIQKINTHKMYDKITANSLGFSIINFTDYKNKCFEVSQNSLPQVNIFNYASSKNIQPIKSGYCYFKVNEEFYYLYYFVNSKVTGNGKIEYPDKSKAGQQVYFKAQAEQNYTVKNVIVKDINGNLLSVNNGSFIMPEEDVIIEAEFVILRNPYTRGGLLGLIIVIICIIIGICLRTKQVKNN